MLDYDMPEWLYAYLMKLSQEQMLEVMSGALDMMQQYNGRSHVFCIVSSVDGSEVIETDKGYTYRLPVIK